MPGRSVATPRVREVRGVLGDRVAQRLESGKPATRQRRLAGGQLHDHAERLDHAARAHLPQRLEPLSRLGVRGKPVTDGKPDFDLRQREGEDRDRQAAAENGPPRPVAEVAGPALPALGCVNPGEHPREPLGPVDVAPENRERPGQKRRCEQHRHRDDDQPADPDRAGLGERRQGQRRESDHDGQSRGHHSGPRRLNGAYGGVDRCQAAVQLLPEARDDEQRVVDADAQPHHRRDVEHEDGHRLELRGDSDDAEGDRNREDADDDRERRGDERPEGEHQHGERQRQRVLLGLPRILRADGADVVVERGIAGDLDVEAVGMRQPPQRTAHRLAQLRDDGPAHIGRACRCQGRDQEGRMAVRADECRFADRAY